MLDLKFIRENIKLVRENAQRKNSKVDIDRIPVLDKQRRDFIQETENLKAKRNIVTKDIAELKKNKENADDKIAAMKKVSDRIKQLDEELRQIETEIFKIQEAIPNILDKDVPTGNSDVDNVVIRAWGEPQTKSKRNHIDIATDLDIIDFERGAKVSGAGFSFYKGKGSALERALINFMIDFHVARHGYTELMPPFLVNAASMFGTGQLPKMADDMYHASEDNLYLIPTAEVPITNYHAGEFLDPEAMPIKYCGYSPCFRREAGSYGKEVRGFLRVHQFNKVEMVNFVYEEDSEKALEGLIFEAEEICRALELPYRVLLLCSGDTSFASAKTYDIEVYTPGEHKWLEVSSCSNFTDFQARRANIRIKRKSKPEFVHTLNGSGLATSRIMVAILENYLNEDGEVVVPHALRRYLNFTRISKK